MVWVWVSVGGVRSRVVLVSRCRVPVYLSLILLCVLCCGCVCSVCVCVGACVCLDVFVCVLASCGAGPRHSWLGPAICFLGGGTLPFLADVSVGAGPHHFPLGPAACFFGGGTSPILDMARMQAAFIGGGVSKRGGPQTYAPWERQLFRVLVSQMRNSPKCLTSGQGRVKMIRFFCPKWRF